MEDAEVVGTLRLPLGGMNGYLNVRGRQGRQKDKYQGCTPNKTRRTKLFDTPREQEGPALPFGEREHEPK